MLADLDPARRHDLRRESPGAMTPVLAHVDSLGIVLANLLSNAWRHGGDEVQVILGIEANATPGDDQRDR